MDKLDVKMVEAKVINICEAPEMLVNYTYTEMGHQMKILDISAPVSVAGVTWLTQYLEEFQRSIKELKCTK